MKRLDSGIQLHGLVSKVCRFFQCGCIGYRIQCCLTPGIGSVTHQQRSRCSLRVDTAFVECVPYFHSRRCTGNLHLETVFMESSQNWNIHTNLCKDCGISRMGLNNTT